MDYSDKLKNWLLFCSSFLQFASGIYLPGINSLTSIDTELPYGYYSLPFCKPLEGVKDSAENLGELLMGDRIENSPYRCKMHVNESELFLCQTNALSADESKVLKEWIHEMYQVNLNLDNLPAIRYINKDGFSLRWTGYPVGIKVKDVYYMFNHLKFTVLVHKFEKSSTMPGMIGAGDGIELITKDDKSVTDAPAYMVVGFEVVPCRFQHNIDLLKNLKQYDKYTAKINCEPATVSAVFQEGKPLVFSYEVNFVESDIKWPSRWDAYLKMDGWKLVVGDVFRVPENSELLSVMVADGCCILGMALHRGTLITGMLTFYVLLGIIAGYVAVWLMKTLNAGNTNGWLAISWRVPFFFPGIAFLIVTILNFLLCGSHSAGAVPFTTYIVLLLLWFCISMPLTLIGGLIGTKAPHLEYPCRSNQIPREIPSNRFPTWMLVIEAGTLPFGTLFIELFFIMSSIWLGRGYYVFEFLLVVLILLVVVCAEVSLVLTYMHLCMEDWRWWWKSFFASSSVAIYIFFYSVNYLVFDLKSLSGPVSAMLYLGYSLLMALAVMLATGAIDFLTSLFFRENRLKVTYLITIIFQVTADDMKISWRLINHFCKLYKYLFKISCCCII
ncbi:unnamed protein product [Withania somnifera]